MAIYLNSGNILKGIDVFAVVMFGGFEQRNGLVPNTTFNVNHSELRKRNA